MNLHKFQQQIRDYLLRSGREADELAFVREDKSISRDVRLQSYRRSLEDRAVDVIAKDFQVTCKFLGIDNYFTYLREYFSAHPSKTHFINEISREFPKFLKKNTPKQAAPFVLELARLEWLMIESFYDYFSMENSSQNSESSKNRLFRVNASLKLIESPWPLDKIWNQEEAFEPSFTRLSIWAMEDRIVRVRSWSKVEIEVLEALQRKSDLDEVIESLDADIPTSTIENVFQNALPEWIRLGILQIFA